MGLTKKRKGILIGLILILLLMVIFARASQRTYQGKVIDAETKEPIEGAVVVAYWWEEKGAFLGSLERLKDVRETLTDRDGKWSIIGPESDKEKIVRGMLSVIAIIWAIRDPYFIIFKPGYCSWPEGFSIDACKDKIKPEGAGQITGGKTIELPKLTNREDRLKSLPGAVEGKNSLEKQKEFIRLINEERRSLGLSGEVYK